LIRVAVSGKRRDGVTLIPHRRGKSVLWDATVNCTLAASYVARTSRKAGAAADGAEADKRRKNESFARNYEIIPLAFETLGSLGEDTDAFLKDLACRIRRETGEGRAGVFFLQRLSVALQRGNALCIQATMGQTGDED